MVAACLVALLPARGEGRRGAMMVVAVAALALVAPVATNILWSPMRHVLMHDDSFRAILTRPDTGDFRAATALIGPPRVTRPRDSTTGAGCRLEAGLIGQVEDEVALLADLGVAPGSRVFVADFQAPHWMFAPLTRPAGAAPWYYNGLPGFDDATHLIVRDCPVRPDVADHILGLIAEADPVLTEIGQGAGVRVLAIGGADQRP